MINLPVIPNLLPFLFAIILLFFKENIKSTAIIDMYWATN